MPIDRLGPRIPPSAAVSVRRHEEEHPVADLSTRFTGIRFVNPFLLASAPPTESESNIERAFEAGWGGVVTKTIGLHPVVNVAGPKTKFLRTDPSTNRTSMTNRPGATLMASWNWELISDKPLDWWLPRIERIKQHWPDRVLVASIMAGSGDDKEFDHWQTLTRGVQEAGADAVELNFSCPHMDRVDMGSNVGKDPVLCSVSTQAVKAAAKVPVWVKLTPATANIVEEAEATFRGGADAIASSNTFPALPLVDPDTLEFEINVDGYVSSGGLGGPAILPLSLAKMAELTKAFPDRAFSGIGGISGWAQALDYFLLGCGTVQVATAAMLDHAIGPNVIRELTAGMAEFLERHADRGWTHLDDFRGLRRGRVIAQHEIRRPVGSEYRGGHEEEAEGHTPANVPA
jgi:dihydropyrimidine dehydrogenase (NAD+) subunit PreA